MLWMSHSRRQQNDREVAVAKWTHMPSAAVPSPVGLQWGRVEWKGRACVGYRAQL